ncbi:hypothetical protein [Kozakia baliensis]|uniref:Uncharacterized protein n=1 Tax=Kozakia baliensis TaxID=153496 RepID=A0A1D8UYU0_9PROT|nr:hypothetical protein [Kozakia baliensis]AOX18825.1 hypothetical protein A0U89_16170 [Kozakia baliensis]GBR32698.1 hypothetical protein AA0488_2605 [Kozakia baliensis NRIC 0488]GEL65513.1 hypothetical protein KBA01_27990 [Kozakia baliensis]
MCRTKQYTVICTRDGIELGRDVFSEPLNAHGYFGPIDKDKAAKEVFDRLTLYEIADLDECDFWIEPGNKT